MALIFGSSTTSFNNFSSGTVDRAKFRAEVNHLVLYFIYLFVGRFAVGYAGTLCICVAAARTTNNLRKAFLESMFRKQVSHFDANGNGSVASQVTTSMCTPALPVFLTDAFSRQTGLASTRALRRSFTTSFRACRSFFPPSSWHLRSNRSWPSSQCASFRVLFLESESLLRSRLPLNLEL